MPRPLDSLPVPSPFVIAADPEMASRYLASFRNRHAAVFERLRTSSTGLNALAAVFANSHFLSEDVLQHPDWLEILVESGDLYRVLSAEEYLLRLKLSPEMPLAVFRRKQLLRIVIRDVLGHATLSEVTEELSNLADSLLHWSYLRILSELIGRYGRPLFQSSSGKLEQCEFSVIALGKLGGRELNYSSDIDLMFCYSENGETDGAHRITNKEFFRKLANAYTDALSTYTADGFCYRVDLRLRPDGRLGEICLSVEATKAYYATRARDWELQMLIKARVAAGEPGPGREFLDSVEARIYSSSLDFSAVEAVSLTRERIHEKAAAKKLANDSGLDIKLARGGIRDIEFLVQCLQRLHGGREPWVRNGGTQQALLRLRDKNLLSESEYGRLAQVYEFLRHLEHRLQFLDDRQTHSLPQKASELTTLARRMPHSLGKAPASGEHLLRRLNVQLEETQELYDRVIHSQQPLYYQSNPVPERQRYRSHEEPSSSNLIRFLDQRAPGLAACLTQRPIRRGHRSFEHFLEKMFANTEYLRMLDESCPLAQDTVELFENSPHFAEELIRHPELIEELSLIRSGVPSVGADLSESLTTASLLRRYFRRGMLRIQAESVCLGVPIFDTLGRNSDLADSAICTAYSLARNALAEHEGDQMMVIALGRLGMREFDLGSDADLLFVLPDEAAVDLPFWTRVAERIIDLLTAYTGEGILFAVDTRLRPNGREGPLVQTVSTYKEYLSKSAEAWEGITYMKSRAVAGNAESTTRFLHELQDVDWRRYGQSGRSRSELRAMRTRLEREQGSVNPLKAGNGGYYDIDFALMYLRLKSAGIFYKVLNTPERIDIIEKMGHLDPTDAEFLREAAGFYRAIDHGLRVYSGHAEGKLPQAQSNLDALTHLVSRWIPAPANTNALPDRLEQIQTRTREYFTRTFG